MRLYWYADGAEHTIEVREGDNDDGNVQIATYYKDDGKYIAGGFPDFSPGELRDFANALIHISEIMSKKIAVERELRALIQKAARPLAEGA